MKFGVREIVDVVFKAADTMKVGNTTFSKYQPVFMIDTATTSSLEQATTTVYAQGGKGNARLIAWEGEKTMTFTVTDALMSPMGLKVLTGAGLINPASDKPIHFHCTVNKTLENGVAKVTLDDLIEETGLDQATSFQVCNLADVKPYATKLDNSGAGIDWFNNVKLTAAEGAEFVEVAANTPAEFTVKDNTGANASGTVQLDFYLIINNKNAATQIEISPDSFGGYFYVEAQTLFRREDSGKDMAAEIIIPRAKVQSAFTFTMAASGDPSTFDFVMDAMPGYTRFDHTKKQMCVIQVLGADNASAEAEDHVHTDYPDPDSPVFHKTVTPSYPEYNVSGSKVPTSNIPLSFAEATELQENQDKATVVMSGNDLNIAITGGVDSLTEFEFTDASQIGEHQWIALDINTGENDITAVKYNGSNFTSQDVAAATEWGLAAGHFILWIKADEVASTPKTFTLSGEGKEDTTVTITVSDAA